MFVPQVIRQEEPKKPDPKPTITVTAEAKLFYCSMQGVYINLTLISNISKVNKHPNRKPFHIVQLVDGEKFYITEEEYRRQHNANRTNNHHSCKRWV